MSGHFELEANQRPDMKRKIVVVGDGKSPPIPTLLGLCALPNLTRNARRLWKDVPVDRLCPQ